MLDYITRFLLLSCIVSQPTKRFYFILRKGYNLFTNPIRGVHSRCKLRKLEKKKKKKFAVLPSPIWGDPIFILKKYIKPYKLAFFSWCKISRYCKIWNGLSTFWKVLGNFFKKITRISKEIELSSPCRAREPKYSGFFLGLRILFKFVKFVNYNGGVQTFGHGVVEFTMY